MDIQAEINPTDLFSPKGLVVVITGGGSGTSQSSKSYPSVPRIHDKILTSSGLGAAIASTLYQNGAAKVYILGRRYDVLLNTSDQIQSSPHGSPASTSVMKDLVCDVTDLDSVKKAVDYIKKDVGYVDVLINNAGVLGPKNGQDIYKAESIEQLCDTMTTGWDGWASAFAINTQAVIGVSAQFLPLLEAANTRRGFAPGKVTGTGIARAHDKSKLSSIGTSDDDDRMAQIITVASVASYMRWVSAGLAYNASKSAAAHLGKMMSTFLSEWGIRSNIVCPGPYPSEMTASNPASYGTNQIPQGRMGNMNDIAGVLLFLVGKGGAYVNGSVQLTDGGRCGVFPAVY
jgi:THO complex subunit 3